MAIHRGTLELIVPVLFVDQIHTMSVNVPAGDAMQYAGVLYKRSPPEAINGKVDRGG